MAVTIQCLRSLVLSLASGGIFLASLKSMNVDRVERVGVKLGLAFVFLGLTHFILLNDFLHRLLTAVRRYNLKSDAMDIANKLVSAIQAVYSCVAGIVVCRSSCARGLNASHFMSDSYAWFGSAYFFYDLWGMYQVHVAKVADKLFLTKLREATNSSTATLAGELKRKPFYDAAAANGTEQQSFLGTEQDSLKYREICDGYENEIKVLSDKQPNFLQYLRSQPLMVGHHVFIGSFGLSVIVFLRGGLGDCIFSYIYIMEASTPFVSFRSILSTMGLKKHRVYVINGILMVLTFFVFRVCLLPYLFMWYAKTINAPVFAAIAGLPRGCLVSIAILFVPQYYWFVLIVRGALQVFYPKRSDGTSKGLDSANKGSGNGVNNNSSKANGNGVRKTVEASKLD